MKLLDKETEELLKEILHREFFGIEIMYIAIAAVFLLIAYSMIASRNRRKNPYAFHNLLRRFEEEWESKFNPEKFWMHEKMLVGIVHYMENKDPAPVIYAQKEYDKEDIVNWQSFLKSLPQKRRRDKLIEEFALPIKKEEEN